MKTQKIGDQLQSTVRIRVCKSCYCEISGLGMCSYGCAHDNDALPNRPWTAYVYARVDTLVEIK